MPKRKRLFVVIGCLLGLAILIGIGPIIIALIMKGSGSNQTLPASFQNEAKKSEVEVSQPEDLSKTEKPKVMLMVTGEIAVVKEDDLSWIILTTGSGKKYILVGPKAEELREASGRRVTVVGVHRLPIPEEIKGKPIRMTIEVKKFYEENNL